MLSFYVTSPQFCLTLLSLAMGSVLHKRSIYKGELQMILMVLKFIILKGVKIKWLSTFKISLFQQRCTSNDTSTFEVDFFQQERTLNGMSTFKRK